MENIIFYWKTKQSNHRQRIPSTKKTDDDSHKTLATIKDKVRKKYNTIFQSPNTLITKFLNKEKH